VSDARTGEQVAEAWEAENDWEIGALAVSPDGKTFATSVVESLRIWDAATGKAITPRLASWRVLHLSYSRDSICLASGSEYDGVVVWDVRTGRRVHAAENSRAGYVPEVAFSPTAPYLAITFGDSIELWEYRN